MFFIGFAGLITSKSIVKAIISTIIIEMAVVFFFLSLGFSNNIRPPIGHDLTNVADPLPQALVLTAIIIGVAVTAVNLTMLIAIYRKLKTTEWDKLEKSSRE
jgi:multicomponent Na+:H+ antiporter subunit C